MAEGRLTGQAPAVLINIKSNVRRPKEGNILDVGGKAVANVTDVRTALTEAQAQGKHDVLMRVKTGSGTRFVAMPLSNT